MNVRPKPVSGDESDQEPSSYFRDSERSVGSCNSRQRSNPNHRNDRIENLTDFLNSPFRSSQLELAGLKVFVRKSRRLHPVTKKPIKTIDIGNILVNQGSDIFTTWLSEAIELAQANGFDAVFVENVFTEQFVDHFRKHGWVEQPQNSFYHLFGV